MDSHYKTICDQSGVSALHTGCFSDLSEFLNSPNSLNLPSIYGKLHIFRVGINENGTYLYINIFANRSHSM